MATQENAITKTGDFMKWFLPKLEAFPRNAKFLFGDRIVALQLSLLEKLIEAYYGNPKLASLKAANIEIEKLRQLIRICSDLRYISIKQLEFATAALNETGGMTGGWIRQQEARGGQARRPADA